jgi:predicted deacylase
VARVCTDEGSVGLGEIASSHCVARHRGGQVGRWAHGAPPWLCDRKKKGSQSVTETAVRVNVDFDAPGKQFGFLQIPRSTNRSAWANHVVPIVCIAHGPGPTALIMGGNHGDEYVGQIAALNLAASTRPEDVHGRIIIIPCLSMEASTQGSRLWPTGANFNRAFPGTADGAVHEQLADFLTRVLFPIADIVCDVHSGGNSLLFLPMSDMHLVADPAQRAAMLGGLLSWNTDYHLIYIDMAGSGLLPTEAERQGKIVVTTELGGGGHLTRGILELAERGMRNMLRHFGVLDGAVETRASLGLPEAVILRATDRRDYILAPETGIYETLVDPGDTVREDQAVGRLHFLERPDRPAEVVKAASDGVVCAVRAIASTQQGDCVAAIGRPCAIRDLL